MNKKKTHILLIGGGHAHVLFLKQLRQKPIDDLQITVVDPSVRVPYTGMLPGYIAGHYTRGELEIDLRQLCQHKNIQFIQDRVVSAQSDANTVFLNSGDSIEYDYASYDVGIHSRLSFITGYNENAVGVKPLSQYADAWQDFIERVDKKQQSNIVIIGGGVAGVEISLAMRYALDVKQNHNVAITIIEHADMLDQVGGKTKKYLLQQLHKKNITTLAHSAVMTIESDRVVLKSGMTVASNLTISAAGARPYSWIGKAGMQTTDGYVTVNQYLQSTSHKNIFAVGDCAHFKLHPLEKAGVFAVRQAPVLYDNINAIVVGAEMRAFIPQKSYLKLISLGGKSAAADKYGLCIRGRLLWRLKNYIDRKFMNQF